MLVRADLRVRSAFYSAVDKWRLAVSEPLSEEVKAAVRKEALSTSAKWLIGGGAALLLLAALGLWYALIPRLSSELGVLPKGAVVAFANDDGCPDGWGRYELAAGRAIIGVRDKPHSGMPKREFRETGGTQFFVAKPYDGDLTIQRSSSPHTNPYNIVVLPPDWTSSIGPNTPGGDAFSMMTPYVTLHYCIKG